MNVPLIRELGGGPVCVGWDERARILRDRFDLVINLEDDLEVASFVAKVSARRIFGAQLDRSGNVVYSDDSSGWFDLSLISRYGRVRADQLKLQNRRSYQHLLFEGLGLEFTGQQYCVPATRASNLRGDVAVAPVAGAVWPMKNWAHYDELIARLRLSGLEVNILPRRSTLSEHIADIRAHRLLLSGDSLPMHIALGVGVPCVTIFNCTSPWEIFDYGIQTKIVSPLLAEYFYKREMDRRATTVVPVSEVEDAILQRLRSQCAGPPGDVGPFRT